MSTQESIAALKTALQTPSEDIAKSFTQPGSATTGLQGYDLEAPAKQLFPINTPLRNMIPRDTSGFGTQASWKAVVAINSGNMKIGVGEGQRSGSINTTVRDYLATYRGFGLEDSVTFEADLSAKNFDDLKARAVEQNLSALMVSEEDLIVGGNTSVQLGTAPTPTLTAAAGGSLPATALSVIVVALGYSAVNDLLGRNNGATGQELDVATAVVPQVVTRNNNDGSTSTFGGGSGQKSAAATVTPGANGQVTAQIVPVPNAYGYAWFWGAAGSEKLGAVTNVSAVVIKAAAAGSQLASSLTATDNSTNALECDGLLTQIQKAGSGSYVKALDGVTKLTADGAGGIVEVSEALEKFFRLFKLSPTILWVNMQEQNAINKLVVSSPIVRLNTEAGSAQELISGRSVTKILNPFTGTLIEVRVHPNMPAGTMMFYSQSIPYKLSGVTDIVKMKLRRDYHAIEWPLRTRKYEYGIYFDGVLQNYFTPAFGVITNIAK